MQITRTKRDQLDISKLVDDDFRELMDVSRQCEEYAEATSFSSSVPVFSPDVRGEFRSPAIGLVVTSAR